MQKIIIEDEINYLNDKFPLSNLFEIFELILKYNYKNLKFLLFISITIIFFYFAFEDILFRKNKIDLKPFKKYIYDCRNSIKNDKNQISKNNNKFPYISICISAFNMENYIEQNLLSILNQSFKDFHIIIINDASNDATDNIIKKIQSDDKRIKLISHKKKLGVYRSRIESIFNSNSEFILLMDPDDMYLNKNLFQELYNYNKKKNLDIIEFSVYRQNEGEKKIYLPKKDFESHYHKFDKDIIYQPELSNILYYAPNTRKYSFTICRNIWNKMIRKEIYTQTTNYIGKKYYFKYIITADDIIMNIISYQFAKNYSNINLPGYLYVKRKISMSRGGGEELKKIRAKNYFDYFELFYKYIKDFNKDRNILFYEMKNLQRFILNIKYYNITEYVKFQINLIDNILSENDLSFYFETYLKKLSLFFKK